MSKDTNESMKYFFEPRAIAVIGASKDTSKIGYKILSNIITGGYKGAVYPVNPGGGEILSIKAYKSLDEIDGEIDVASIVIPAQFVINAVQGCAKRGVKHVQIITSGFSELGNTEEEREIVSIARSHGMRVLGPNIFGIYSSVSS